MMIENVSRYLRRGGIFIGTIPNAELLLQVFFPFPPLPPFFSPSFFLDSKPMLTAVYIPHRERLNELPEHDEELRFGNSCYSIQFRERQHKGVYGHDYRFYLTDAVEDVPEYLVDWENFVSCVYSFFFWLCNSTVLTLPTPHTLQVGFRVWSSIGLQKGVS